MIGLHIFRGSLQVGAVDDFGEGDYPGTATVMVGRTDTKSTPLSINLEVMLELKVMVELLMVFG